MIFCQNCDTQHQASLWCCGGTPYCVTIDFDTLEDDTVTVRHRDTTKQKRIKIGKLISEL